MELYSINALPPLVIGRQDDNLVEEIFFDITPWVEQNPALVAFRVEVTSPSGAKYIAPNQRQEGNNLVAWVVTNVDTAVPGVGEYEIVAIGEDGEQKTSAHASLHIKKRAGGAPGGVPDYETPLLDKVANYVQQAEDAAARAEEAASSGGSGLPEVTGPFMALSTDEYGKPGWSKLLAYEAPTVEILPETELVKQSANTFYLVPAISEILVPGELYTVTFNGAAYTCEAIPVALGPHGAFALGNAAAVMGTGDTGEPFALLTSAIGAMSSDYYAQVFTVEDVDAATIAVARGGVKKIDPRYLPDDSVVLTSPNGIKFTLKVSDGGDLSAVVIV